MHSKKGSHVGMVLSFVIFITFLTFLYAIVEPTIRIGSGKSNVLEYLRKEIPIQTSDILVSVTVTGENSENKNCWLINHTNFIDPNKITYNNMGVIVKDKNNNIISSVVSYPPTLDLTLIDWSGKENFSKIYYSNESFTGPKLNYTNGDCITGSPIHELGLVVSREEVFETKIIKMLERYNNSYFGLKKDLRMPFDSDFSFSFVLSNETELRVQEKEAFGNIFSGEYPIQYIDSEANIAFGTLKIKVW